LSASCRRRHVRAGSCRTLSGLILAPLSDCGAQSSPPRIKIDRESTGCVGPYCRTCVRQHFNLSRRPVGAGDVSAQRRL
jgi:hypothetical protein